MVNLTVIINQIHDALAVVQSQRFDYSENTNWKRVLLEDPENPGSPYLQSPHYVRVWEGNITMKVRGSGMRSIQTTMTPDEAQITAEVSFPSQVVATDFLEEAQSSVSDICASGLAADIRLSSVSVAHPPANQGAEEGTKAKLAYTVVLT